MIISAEEKSGALLPLDSLIILARLRKERRLGVAELAEAIQKNESAARAVLERLAEAGFVTAQGIKKGRTYMLSANVYQTLGKPDGYIRQAGFNAIQQEQMVIQFAKENKKITRKEAAFLCQINENQASHLLRRLKKIGKLKLVGKGRGAFYVLP